MKIKDARDNRGHLFSKKITFAMLPILNSRASWDRAYARPFPFTKARGVLLSGEDLFFTEALSAPFKTKNSTFNRPLGLSF